jgi:hypothetical protein
MCVSSVEEDFDTFYHSMYIPFLAVRHADLANPRRLLVADRVNVYGQAMLNSEAREIVLGGQKMKESDE